MNLYEEKGKKDKGMWKPVCEFTEMKTRKFVNIRRGIRIGIRNRIWDGWMSIKEKENEKENMNDCAIML